jgi:putative transposase
VHFGTAPEIRAQRADTLTAAYERHPNRSGHVHNAQLPSTVWINRPAPEPVVRNT